MVKVAGAQYRAVPDFSNSLMVEAWNKDGADRNNEKATKNGLSFR